MRDARADARAFAFVVGGFRVSLTVQEPVAAAAARGLIDGIVVAALDVDGRVTAQLAQPPAATSRR